jgi:hypothetical protein
MKGVVDYFLFPPSFFIFTSNTNMAKKERDEGEGEGEGQEKGPKTNTYFFSMGHRCSSSGILKNLQLKTESYPFDWLVSKLSVITDCIANDFTEFLDTGSYDSCESITANVLDRRVVFICSETPEVNRYYSEKIPSYTAEKHMDGGIPITYWHPLAFTHHSLKNEEQYAYMGRCVERFKTRLASGYMEKKRYLYIHPYIGVYEYDRSKHDLKREWLEFSNKLAEYGGDWKGVMMVPVFLDKGMECRDIVWEELFRTPKAVGWKVEISNWAFKDGGETFSGDYEQELRNIEAMVRKEFMEDLPDVSARKDLDAVTFRFSP